MKYEKGSFIVIPNKGSIVGIGAGPQATYTWLCDFANTDGACFPSRSLLADRVGCTVRSIDEYVKVLEMNGLVVKENRVLNNEKIPNLYYIPLGGSANSALPSADSAPGGSANSAHRTQPTSFNSTHTSEAPLSQEKVYEDENTKKPRSAAKYPHSKEVFSWFPNPQASWSSLKNVQEREYAEYLYKRGEKAVRGILVFCGKNGDSQFFPAWKSPSKLEKNWQGIQDFADRNEL